MARAVAPDAPNQLSDEKLQQMLEAAMAEFQRCGVDNARMDSIARRAGVSKATIYRRYATKDELFEHAVLVKADRIAGQLLNFELDAEEPAASLYRAARVIRATTVGQIEFMRLLVAESNRRSEITQKVRIQINRQLVAKMKGYFLVLIDAGKMDPVDVDTIIWSFFILSVGGLRPFFGVTREGDEEERRLQTDLSLFFKGCGIAP